MGGLEAEEVQHPERGRHQQRLLHKGVHHHHSARYDPRVDLAVVALVSVEALGVREDQDGGAHRHGHNQQQEGDGPEGLEALGDVLVEEQEVFEAGQPPETRVQEDVLDLKVRAGKGVGQGYIRREGTSEAAPEAVGPAVAEGCRSGWGRLLSVTNAIEAGTWHGIGWAPWRGRGTSPRSNASLGVGAKGSPRELNDGTRDPARPNGAVARGGGGRVLDGRGPRRRLQRRSGRGLKGVTKAPGGGYCRVQCRWGWQLWSGRERLGIGWGPGEAARGWRG